MNNKERQEMLRKLASAATPWQDRFRAWVTKWMGIVTILILLYLLVDAYSGPGAVK